MQKTITTFSELERYSRAFADGHFEVMILVGDPGLEKSTLLRKALEGKDARWIEGTLSAFQLYCEAWEYKDLSFAIDDVDNLYGDRDSVRLLKCLCQTEPVKRLGWHTNAARLDKDGIPREFGTKSPVAIIANEWKVLSKNLGALEDRGMLIYFRPPAREVHERVGCWFTDGEIYGAIGGLLHLITAPSIRHYINCRRLKVAGLDWRTALYESLGITGETLAVALLLDDKSFATGEARVAEFVKRTGQSRATYFRIVRKLRGCEPQEDRRDGTDAARRLSDPTPTPGSENPGPEEGRCPGRSQLYFRPIEGRRIAPMRMPNLVSNPNCVRFVLGAIADGTIVTYRGEVLTDDRLLEVIETARVESGSRPEAEPGVAGDA